MTESETTLPSGYDIVKIGLLERYNQLDALFSNYMASLRRKKHDVILLQQLTEMMIDLFYKMNRSWNGFSSIKTDIKNNIISYTDAEKIIINSYQTQDNFTYDSLIKLFLFLQEAGRRSGLFTIGFIKKDWSKMNALRGNIYG